MYMDVDDYAVVIGTKALDVVSQTDEAIRTAAQKEAVEEISGYLRPKYDCDRIFSAEGEARNGQILMYACDIALYHMTSSTPMKMGMEIRKERYDRAIQWLEDVQSGKILPDIPEAVTDDGESAAPSVLFGSKKCVDNSY